MNTLQGCGIDGRLDRARFILDWDVHYGTAPPTEIFRRRDDVLAREEQWNEKCR